MKSNKNFLTDAFANSFSGYSVTDSTNFSSFSPTGMFGYGGGMRSYGRSQTNDHGSLNRSASMQYDEYYKALEDDPFTDTLVDCLYTPVLEIIDTLGQHVQVEGRKDEDGEYLVNKDAIIIINNFFKDSNFKEHIVNNLRDFIRRGSYYSYIDYANRKLVDVIDPFNYYIIKGANGTGWLKPDVRVDDNSGFNSTVGINKNSLTGNTEANLLAAEQFSYYYYELQSVKTYSKKGSMSGITSSNEKAKAMFEDSNSRPSYQSLTKDANEQLENLLCLCNVSRPKSMFDPHLKNLLTLSVKKFIHSHKEMLDVMRSELIAINFHDNIDSEKVSEIITKVNTALNKHNPEFLRSFESPSTIIGTVMNKLINQLRVVPSNDAMSDMGVVPQPDYKTLLPELAASIAQDEANAASYLGIPQEIVTGTSNRWEAMSHSDKYFLKVKAILNSLELYIKQTACNLYYLHTNELYWKQKKYAKDNNLEGGDYEEAEQYKSFGRRIDINDIVFRFESDDLMESNVSKSKSLIIGEKLTTMASILDNVNTICSMPGVKRPEFNRYLKDKFEILAGDDYDFLELEETTEPEYSYDEESQQWYDGAGNPVDQSEVPPAYLQGMGMAAGGAMQPMYFNKRNFGSAKGYRRK